MAIAAWACFVLVSAGIAVSYYQHSSQNHASGKFMKAAPGTETIKIRQISVPLMKNGAIQGYVVAKFSAVITLQKVKDFRPAIEELIVDEIIKEIFLMSASDVSGGGKSNLSNLTMAISKNINIRVASELVQDVLINEFAFVEKAHARK